MKKIIFILSLLAIAGTASAQFPSKDSAERFINKWIRNSAIDAFTNLRLNQAMIYTLRYADSANVISFTALNDSTLRLITRGKDTFTVIVRGTGGGGSGSGTVNTGTQYQLSYYAANGTAVSGHTIITASRALVSDANGLPVASATTATELGYVNGVTSSIQTQLNGKASSTPPGSNEQVIINDAGSFGADAGLTYNKVQNKVTTDTVFSSKVRADSVNLSISSSFATPSALLGVGDSYIAGFRPCTPDTIFFDRLADIYDLTGYNWGVSSTGILRADSAHNYRVNPGHSFMSFVWAGFNDIRRGGINNDTTYRKIIWGLKAIIANHYLKNYFAGGVTGNGVTRYGSWTTTYTSAAVGGKSPNNGAYTNTLNDSLTYTFTDTTLVLSMIGGDHHAAGYNMGDFEIFIDNVSQGTFNGLIADGISDGFNDNARSPMTFIFTGLANTSHKVKVVNKEAKYVVVDYVGHLVDASSAYPLLIAHAPYNNIAGFAVSPNKGSVAANLKLNNQIDSMVAVTATAYPIFVLPTNSFLDTLTGLCTDNIHPDNDGDIQITNGALSVIPTIATAINNGTIVFDGGHFKGKAQGTTHIIPWLDETLPKSDSSRFILAQTGYDQGAGFRINGSSILKNKLTVGSTALSDGADQLDIITSSSSNHMRVLGFSGENYWQSVNSANTTGVPFNFGAGAIKFGAISGGSTTTFATFDNSGANKLVLTGNALFNSTVRLGLNVVNTNAPVTAGTMNGTSFPVLGMYYAGAGTDRKITDIHVDDTAWNVRFVDDANSTPGYALRVTRTANAAKMTYLFGKVRLSTAPDSSAPSGGFLFRDFATGDVRLGSALVNPMTTAGDIITSTTGGAATRLAKGTANQVIGMNNGATVQEYKTLTGSASVDIAHSAGAVTFSIPTTFADADSYSPTLTAIANVDAVSLVTGTAHYLRIKDEVSVDLALSIDPTAATTTTNVDITLPFASTMTNFENLTGILTADGINGNVAAVGNKARIGFTSVGTGATTFNIHFKYKIQ